MPRLMVPILACALGVGAAFALVSCGGSDNKGLLPGSTASEIVANIDKAQSALDAQDCDTVIGFANAIQSQVEGLPATVDPKLRSSLDKGAKRLLNLASGDNCGLTTGSTTAPTTEETTAPTTESTTTKETTKSKNTTKSTSTTSTNTTPTNSTPTTVPTTPPPTTPTPPPSTTAPPGGGIGPGGAVGGAGRTVGG